MKMRLKLLRGMISQKGSITKTAARSVVTNGNTTRSKLIKNIPANKGYRKDCPEIKGGFKSSMEANVYRFYKTKLGNGKIKNVEYEPEIFYFRNNKFGIKAYVPDFKITTNSGSWFIEVKGKLDDTSRQKSWLLSTQYPWIKLYFILPKQYNTIKKYYASNIKGWE